ncbi:hypothetical protein BDR26DRAFT_695285 [Obelidium mucronatum]|nr:hypothetical protein BDR26DRAFT_695285 [Obelidium mucronatum]
MAFATIYLLLASGFLELTIASCSERINNFKYANLTAVDDPQDLIRDYQEYTDNIYRIELKGFAIRVLAVFVFVSSLTGIYAYFSGTVYSVFWTYSTACVNLTGLLVGLFNKMFVTVDEHLLNKFLAGSIFVGLVVSSTLIGVMGDQTYSLLATGLGCWGFAICCLVVRFRERTRSPYYDISIGPSLRTSGQRAVGYKSNDFTRNQRSLYAKQLLEQKDTFKQCSQHSPVGLECLRLFEHAISTAQLIDALAASSNDLILVLQLGIQWFGSGLLVIREVPGVLEAGGVEYSAIAAKSGNESGDNVLEIFVSRISKVSDSEKAMMLCESIVHELSEELGWTHSRACVMEVLLNMCWGNTTDLPHRIRRELGSANALHCAKIISNSEFEVSKCSSFGVDINRYWGGGHFTDEERKFLIAIAKEWNSLASADDSAKAKQHALGLCNLAPTTLVGKLQRLLFKPDKNYAPLNVIMEHCILMSIMTSRISSFAANCDGINVTLQRHNTVIGRSVLGKLSDTINVHFAVYYFAITCDTSFSREVAHLPLITRAPLCLLHSFNQTMFDQINQLLLFRRSQVIADFQRRSELGISRIHHFKDSILDRIEVLEGADVATTALVRPHENNTRGTSSSGLNRESLDTKSVYLDLIRYAGGKPKDWTPKDSDKPTARVLVEKSRDALRLVHEKFLSPAGAVVKMHVYTFNAVDDKFPDSRLVFDHEVPSDSLKLYKESTEVHRFYTNGPLLGLIRLAELKRKNKVSKADVVILVEFGYNLPLVSKTPSRAIFTRRDNPAWKLAVEYAPFSDSEAPLQPWTVKYCDGVSGTNLLIKYDYSHPKHVVTRTVLDTTGAQTVLVSLNAISSRDEIPTPPEILDDHYGIMKLPPPKNIYDSCELLTRDLNAHRRYEFNRTHFPFFLNLQKIEYCTPTPYVTRYQRDILWATWRAGKIPGVFARILDQTILRKEPALTMYWKLRFTGKSSDAVRYLEENRDHLNNVLYVADKPATRTRLQIRFSDLLIMGNGGDSENISSFDQFDGGSVNQEDTLEAICLDSGTWPTGGGGVGSCRRDVVDSLASVRWTAIAEIAEMELEKKDYQIEKNIKAIIYLPIFDNDLGSPMENFYKTTAFGDLRVRANKTTDAVVAAVFVPLVKQLVEAIMTQDLDSSRIQHDEHMIVSLYKYFRTHDWKLSWNHPLTQRVWMKLFLKKAKEMEKAHQLLKHESPTLAHISMLFTLTSRLLLILSKEIPKVPVIHVSHHGTQSLIAVISKVIYGSSVIVWDHGMLFRERMYALCRDGMPVFTQIGFIGLTRLCTRLIYNRADYVTPCTNIQNVMWAAHLAGGKYMNEFERVALHSKCSAVLNGMNLKRFSIKRELARKTPTAVMLSHISPLKDVMNAIKAAYHVVHEFKLKSYQLHVYGSPEVDMAYTLACRMAIKELNLESNVILKGLGNPSLVLPTGWIFVNSSITEGLPLAIGEAGLCGLPVVCTNVGGSLEVISDLKTGALYGAIVPPSRSRQLALGQLQVFAMANGLDTFVDPSRTDSPGIQELIARGPEALEERIMDPEVGQMRERLGELFGLKTQSVFSISRYCREHEQVLWLGELYSRKC